MVGLLESWRGLDEPDEDEVLPPTLDNGTSFLLLGAPSAAAATYEEDEVDAVGALFPPELAPKNEESPEERKLSR